jgi:uncharacterized Tic20 family protein
MGDAQGVQAAGGGSGTDENTMAMLCHLLALAGIVVPFGNIVGPLIIWLIKKDEMPAVDRNGKEALNFNISFTIYFVAASMVCAVLALILIGILLFLVLAVGGTIFWIIMVVQASMAAKEGRPFRYPITIRFFT